MFDLSCGVRLRGLLHPPSPDLDNVLSMYNNIQLAPLIAESFIVPRGQKLKEKMKEAIESDSVEMFCIIETIPEGLYALPNFVGITALWVHGERGNRHSTFAIGLMPAFWSKGYGTEITKFVVNHAFMQLNMHRISLEVFEGNERAISVYKRM